MADSKRNTSSRYVRSAYRRSGPGQPDYGQSNNRGQIWSVIIVLLLIVVLTGGAIWMYLGRQDEAVIPRDEVALRGEEEPPEEVAPREREAVIPREEPTPREEVEPRPREEVAEPREDVAPPPREEEDEFAALLEELGITEERERREPAPAEPREEPVEEPEVIAEPEEDPAVAVREEDEVAIFEDEAERTAREREERWARLEEEELPQTVTVRPGDSLSRIAGRVYGDINKWRLIYEANQDRLEDPDKLLVGMELKVPARED
jgi:nucleoid-associated protein YgaU